MINMWMVRAGPDSFLINEFLDLNVIAIGWNLGDLTNKSSEEITELFKKKYSSTYSANQVIKFVQEINVGDYVVTPDNKNNIYLGKITSDYYYSDLIKKTDSSGDHYFDVRNVEWLGVISKSLLKKSTRATLGSQSTIYSIKEEPKKDILNIFDNINEIKQIRTVTLANTDPDCLTFEMAINYLSFVLINQRDCKFHYIRRNIDLIGKTLVLFKYGGRLIGKGFFYDEIKEPVVSNGVEYNGSFLVEKDSIGIFDNPIDLKELQEYVPDVKTLTRDQIIDMKYLDEINRMIKKHICGVFCYEKRNLIYFGAPGTGKSYNLNNDMKKLTSNYERVTFHPDYSYANFVGTYKPVPKGDSISYEYVPGPFMRSLVKSLKNPSEPFLLIIEEINRSNVAAVFGDVFQLLDRDSDNTSRYPIEATEDMKTYLKTELNEDIDKISIPSNLFIWATMNSADQGVFPMDTAFKRRWDFKYFGINYNEQLISNIGVELNNQFISWNDLRKAINKELLTYRINEDKLLGPFFAFNEYLDEQITVDEFKDIFKNKIIMYLFEDAARSRRNDLFSGVAKNANLTYSQICEAFDKIGIEIFCDNIKEMFINEVE